jgi:hypothetical protein
MAENGNESAQMPPPQPPSADPAAAAEPLTVLQVANHCRHDTPRVPFELIMQRCGGSYEDKHVRWLGPDHSGSVPGPVLCVGGRPIYCSDVHPTEAQYAEIVAFVATRARPACDAAGRSAAGLLWGAPVAFTSAEAVGALYAQPGGRQAVEAFFSELVHFHRTGAAPATWPHKA